jgi:urease accessory protein UreF
MRAQALGASLIPTISEALQRSLSLDPADMRAVGPEFDVAAIRHRERDGRLFAT